MAERGEVHPGIVWVVDSEMRARWAAGLALSELGFTSNVMSSLDQVSTFLEPGPAGRRLLRAMRSILAGGPAFDDYVRYAQRHYWTRMDPIVEGGTISGIIGISIDITNAPSRTLLADAVRRRSMRLVGRINDVLVVDIAKGVTTLDEILAKIGSET